MGNIIANLFREHRDFNDFRTRVIELGGGFTLGYEDMLDIGEAYFERFPDCFSNRNCSDVTLGYKLVRICIIEKLVEPIPVEIRGVFRGMFQNLSLIGEGIPGSVSSVGAERTGEILDGMSVILKGIQDTIDALPTGMIKERFVGGISYIYNIIYLMKNTLMKSGAAEPGHGNE